MDPVDDQQPRPTGAPRTAAGWPVAVAYVVVVLPLVVSAVRVLATSTPRLALPDDLALIDLHTRQALGWHQQVGVFDRYNWSHPGPSYFYLQSVVYRLVGNDQRTLFLGASLLTAGAAAACLAVLHRRTSPTRLLGCAVVLAGFLLTVGTPGPTATTYSETTLGVLLSPWNPTVVIVPALLLVLLCAAALDRSGPALAAAVLVGTFVLQTDLSVAPLLVPVVAVAAVGFTVTALRDRRSSDGVRHRPAPRSVLWVTAALVATALAWLPPLVQEVTGHPGNLTLIVRYFTAGHPGQGLAVAVRSTASAFAAAVVGPAEVMARGIASRPEHAVAAVAVGLATPVVALAAVAAGVRDRRRFGAGLGILALVAAVAVLLGTTRVVGPVFGYLVLWASVVPVAAVLALAVTLPAGAAVRPHAAAVPRDRLRVAVAAVAVAAGVGLTLRVVSLPPVTTAGDPQVTSLARLVLPRLPPRATVAVQDAGAGPGVDRLFDLERFFGLVVQLDRAGDAPRVSPLWRVQVGPGFVQDGATPWTVLLTTWTPTSSVAPGYVGRVGDMAVDVTASS